MEDVSTEFVYFMKQLYKAFPEFSSKEMYITGESYGGHYIPAFSNAIIEDGSFNL